MIESFSRPSITADRGQPSFIFLTARANDAGISDSKDLSRQRPTQETLHRAVTAPGWTKDLEDFLASRCPLIQFEADNQARGRDWHLAGFPHDTLNRHEIEGT
jgi:hypothetical protein